MDTIKELLDIADEKFGAQPAVQYINEEKTITEHTFSQLKKKSCAVSNALFRLNKNGEHIALVGNSGYLWLYTYLGIVNSGSVVVTIDVRLPHEEIADEIVRSDVSVIIYDPSMEPIADYVRQNCPDVDCFLVMSGNTKNGVINMQKLLTDDTDYNYHLDPYKCCTIMFTSGTSGKSKGVMLCQKGLVDNAMACAVRNGFNGSNTKILSILPIFHIFCLSVDILWSLHNGVCICFNDNLANMFDNLHQFKANRIAMVPMMAEYILMQLKQMEKSCGDKKAAAEKLLGTDFLTLTVGGAYLKQEIRREIEQYGLEIKEQYGMTENSCNLCTEHGCISKPGYIGKILDTQEFRVVDGEIWVKGSTVMLGYYKDQKSTDEVVLDGWLKTGDLGEIDSDGYLKLIGRKKLLINLSSGENVSSEQLEQQLLDHDFIKEVVVYQVGDKIAVQIYPSLNVKENYKPDDVNETAQKIVQEVNAANPTYKHIHKVIVREKEFEKTASMKIKRESFLYHPVKTTD